MVQMPPLQYAVCWRGRVISSIWHCGGARNWLGDKDIVADHKQLIHVFFQLRGHISCMDSQFVPINFTLFVDLGVDENQCTVRV